MTNNSVRLLLHIVYSYGGHCGHEVIDRIFTDKQKAIDYTHNQNIEWSKNGVGYWDGATKCYHLISKYLDDSKDLDFECDVCGFSDPCDCFPNKEYKNEKLYEKYWVEERRDHNHNHLHEKPTLGCKFCDDDKTLWWIPAIKQHSGESVV